MTLAKGITRPTPRSAQLVACEKVVEPFFAEPPTAFTHGLTFGGHPLSCAIALANIEIMESEGMIGHVQRMTPEYCAPVRASSLASTHGRRGARRRRRSTRSSS